MRGLSTDLHLQIGTGKASSGNMTQGFCGRNDGNCDSGHREQVV